MENGNSIRKMDKAGLKYRLNSIILEYLAKEQRKDLELNNFWMGIPTVGNIEEENFMGVDAIVGLMGHAMKENFSKGFGRD